MITRLYKLLVKMYAYLICIVLVVGCAPASVIADGVMEVQQ